MKVSDYIKIETKAIATEELMAILEENQNLKYLEKLEKLLKDDSKNLIDIKEILERSNRKRVEKAPVGKSNCAVKSLNYRVPEEFTIRPKRYVKDKKVSQANLILGILDVLFEREGY